MISIEKLRSVTHVVSHFGCPDGISSALILKDALPDVKVSFMAYGTAEHRELEPVPGMLFVDFTPYINKTRVSIEWGERELPNGDIQAVCQRCGEDLPRVLKEHACALLSYEQLAPWIKEGVIVLDHHPTARNIVEAFGENGVFGLNEKNECGAWLAYEQVWKQIAEPKYTHAWAHERDKVRNFAQLAAIRDTWKTDDPRWAEACQQAATLVFFGIDHFLGMSWGFVEDQIESVGEVLIAKQLSAAQRSLGESHSIITSKGTHVLMFQGVSTTSDAAEILEKEEGGPPLVVNGVQLTADVRTNLVVGFHYRFDASKLQLQFSMRSHTGYDCSAFAKAHGGGGHKAAAGFTVEVSPELSANPYQTFRLLLEQWEGRADLLSDEEMFGR